MTRLSVLARLHAEAERASDPWRQEGELLEAIPALLAIAEAAAELMSADAPWRDEYAALRAALGRLETEGGQ